LDRGYLHSISIEQIERGILSSRLFAELQEALEQKIDLSLLVGSDQEGLLLEALRDVHEGIGGREGRKFGVEKSGICLLIAYILEVLQRNAQWEI